MQHRMTDSLNFRDEFLDLYSVVTLTASIAKKKKKHVPHNKYESPVSEVELLEAKLHYALIRHPDGKQSNVSLRGLSPTGRVSNLQEGSTSFEPIKFLTDSTDDKRPVDSSAEKSREDWNGSDIDTRYAA